jgi:hypothetical protein
MRPLRLLADVRPLASMVARMPDVAAALFAFTGPVDAV